MFKRIMSLILIFGILMGLFLTPAFARGKTTVEQMADVLYEAKLFQGTGKGQRDDPIYSLSKSASRAEAITMLIRIMGEEQTAKAGTYDLPFTDVPKWARAYVGYAYAKALTNGTSKTTFSSEAPIEPNQYLTFCLRALGYVSGKDFSYRDPYAFAEKAGFQTASALTGLRTITRSDLVLLSCDTLLCKCSGSSQTLGEKLKINSALLEKLSSLRAVYVGTPTEKPMDYASFLQQINAERVEEMDYVPQKILSLSTSHEYDDLLSHEECEMLIRKKDQQAYITKAQAAEDAEYLWKAFASAYGGYYYFGDETFKNAHKQVLETIRKRAGSTIAVSDFDQILAKAYGFIQDNHFRYYAGKQYAPFYVKGLYLYEDTKGFYQKNGGEKWYLKSMDKGDLADFVQVTIAPTGELVYGLYHRFLSATDPDMPHSLTMTNGKESKTIALKWAKSISVGLDESEHANRVFATENLEGHNVIKIRGFDYYGDRDHNEHRKNLDKYMQTGTAVSGQDYVIVDARANGGGSCGCPLVWMNHFLGDAGAKMGGSGKYQLSSSNSIYACESRLSDYMLHKLLGEPIRRNITEYSRENIINHGIQVKNSHPLFMLTDYLAGSAGEGVITQARTVENTLIIGTNTFGCMFGSVQIQIYLPNSGLYVGFGDNVTLEAFMNREGYGYDPDIWVPAEYALELTLKLCNYYGLNDPDAAPLPTYGELPARVDLKGYSK